MNRIDLWVKGQSLAVSTPVVAADFLNTVEVQLLPLTLEWAETINTVVFQRGSERLQVVLTDCKAVIATLSAGTYKVAVIGSDVVKSRRYTTNTAELTVQSTLLNGDPFPDVTPSVGEVFVEKAKEYAETAQNASGEVLETAEQVKEMLEDAKEVVDNLDEAERIAKQIHDDIPTIEGFATSAGESAQMAEESSTRAESAAKRAEAVKMESDRVANEAKQAATNAAASAEQAQNTVQNVSVQMIQLSESINKVDTKIFEAQTVIENHIKATPDYGVYTVRFPLWETSHTCVGEKMDDNQGLILTPATDTIKEVNTYPHCFDTIDVNAYVDENGVRHITAIKGDKDFKDTGNVDVFVCLRTYWEKTWKADGYEYYSRCYYPKEGYTINSLAINRDGSYNPWFLISKYMAGNSIGSDGKPTHNLYSAKDLKPAHYMASPVGDEEISESISWSGMQPIFKKKGTFYTGSLAAELKHITTSMWLYFATKNSQSIMYGYTNSSFQYVCAEPTTDKNYFVVTESQANNIDVLQCVTIGDNTLATAPDRNGGLCHNIAYDVRVIAKEKMPSGNVAIIIDHAPFTTTETSWISSFYEVSGYSDFILGRNGSPVSNTNGRHGMVLDGIEITVGGYETLGNMIYNATSDPLVRELLFVNDATKLSTNMDTFKQNASVCGYLTKVTTNGTWNYVTEVEIDLANGIIVNTESGGSGSGSSYGYADAQYFDSATSGQREFLSLGHLGLGSAAGPCFVAGNNGVTGAHWHILARPSINAVRGELRSEAKQEGTPSK